jgi:hypothetical protein
MSDELNIKDAANYIHYQPERVDYSISEGELGQLRQCTDNLWKDFCLFCTGGGIPCLINAISEARSKTPFQATLSFNLNLVIGVVGLLLGFAFGIAWYRSRQNATNIVSAIKSKPRMRLQ